MDKYQMIRTMDLSKTIKSVSFVAATKISDSIMAETEAKGFSGLVTGFYKGLTKLAMEPKMLSSAVWNGGSERTIELCRVLSADELYLEGYLQSMLDTAYKEGNVEVRVAGDQVSLSNLPPSTFLLNDIEGRVKAFLKEKDLLKGDELKEPSASLSPSSSSSTTAAQSTSTTTTPAPSIRHILGKKVTKSSGSSLTALGEQMTVLFLILVLKRKILGIISAFRRRGPSSADTETKHSLKHQMLENVKWKIYRFVLSSGASYANGLFCKHISNNLARRVVSGVLLALLNDGVEQTK
ncbi:hypothetical protein Sjap_016806 [Stephania japonica]|uniref:Uncharacterized protein n=1 Tax=Stephania japonica TaxID=461633 RepID=A0AAP0NL85_9MAGN